MQFYEDLVVGAVERFGRYEVTREEVLDFARKYDPQAFHLDDAAAARTHFGRLAASGWHTAAMTMAMLVAHWQGAGYRGLGSPGIDELRWLRPVYPGDVLSVEAELLMKRRSKTRPERGIIRSASRTLNQHGEVVMTMVSNGMVEVGDPAAPIGE